MAIRKILIVDDELIVRNLFGRIFANLYEVVLAENGTEARQKAKEQDFDLAFVDIVMPGIDGIETIMELKKLRPSLRIVVMTGFAVDDKVRRAMDLGARECLYKPFTLREVEMLFSRLTAE